MTFTRTISTTATIVNTLIHKLTKIKDSRITPPLHTNRQMLIMTSSFMLRVDLDSHKLNSIQALYQDRIRNKIIRVTSRRLPMLITLQLPSWTLIFHPSHCQSLSHLPSTLLKACHLSFHSWQLQQHSTTNSILHLTTTTIQITTNTSTITLPWVMLIIKGIWKVTGLTTAKI